MYVVDAKNSLKEAFSDARDTYDWVVEWQMHGSLCLVRQQLQGNAELV